MTIEQQAEIARKMTGSNLDTDSIIRQVMNVPKEIKETVCSQVNMMVKHYNLPFDQAFYKVRDGYNKISTEFDLDPAVLFWIYMEWLHDQNE